MRKVALSSLIVIFTSSQTSYADVGWTMGIAPSKRPSIRVAVIDTGIDPILLGSNTYCDYGHKDFTGGGLVDNHGHGTHISSLIDQYAKDFIFEEKMVEDKYDGKPFKQMGKDIDNINIDYCQIVLKYYDPKVVGNDNLKRTILAFKWAIKLKVNVINYSGGGLAFSKEEHDVVLEALNKGIKIVAAAGNEYSDIDESNYFPAMYDKREYIVGNLDPKAERCSMDYVNPMPCKLNKKFVERTKDLPGVSSSSNYGKSVNTWEIGTSRLARLPAGKFGLMTGTSQSAAIKSGKLVREMLPNK